MNNKKIIKFPVGRKECTGIVNRPCRDFELGRGYDEIRFSSKKVESDFKESMRLFTEFIENIGSSKYLTNIEKAINLSKYNVDARVWEIVSRDCSEFDIEQALKQLKEEAYSFDEGVIIGKLFPINYFHLRVCQHLAEFYLGSKLYNKVIKAYEPLYIVSE